MHRVREEYGINKLGTGLCPRVGSEAGDLLASRNSNGRGGVARLSLKNEQKMKQHTTGPALEELLLPLLNRPFAERDGMARPARAVRASATNIDDLGLCSVGIDFG